MPSITLKELPARLHEQLKRRATANHRSLNREVIATLEEALAGNHATAANVSQPLAARTSFARSIKVAELAAWKQTGRL